MVSVIDQLERAQDTSASAVCKGLAFVQFYGAYEYAVRGSVQAALGALGSAGLEIRALRREMLTLILDPMWKSAGSSSPAHVWERRASLISSVDSPALTTGLSDTLFPYDGSHYRVPQLETIWRVFAIPGPIVAEPRHLGRIEELVENRNAISHGRRTPEDVGRRYSSQEIGSFMADTYAICNHIVSALEAHSRGGGVLAP